MSRVFAFSPCFSKILKFSKITEYIYYGVTGGGLSKSIVTITYEEGGRSQYGESPVTGMFGGNPLVGIPLTKHSVTIVCIILKSKHCNGNV